MTTHRSFIEETQASFGHALKKCRFEDAIGPSDWIIYNHMDIAFCPLILSGGLGWSVG